MSALPEPVTQRSRWERPRMGSAIRIARTVLYIVVCDQHSRGENMLKMTRLAMLAAALIVALPAAQAAPC